MERKEEKRKRRRRKGKDKLRTANNELRYDAGKVKEEKPGKEGK